MCSDLRMDTLAGLEILTLMAYRDCTVVQKAGGFRKDM